MKATNVAKDVYWVGANVHTEDLFEGIWPLPYGVALNSYIVKGEKTAIVELVREWGGASHILMENLNSINISPDDIDYVILNHLEPDHTGLAYLSKNFAPKAKFIATEKGAKLLEAFYEMKDNVIGVKTGDEIDLGKGKKFIFTEIPNVHWPETMATYEPDSKVLFTGDAFGAFGVHEGSIFDDETPEVHKQYWEGETLRYYSNIISMFSSNVLKAIDDLKHIDIKVIAPSHGLVWRGNPQAVINKYVRYANYNKDFGEPEICVIWGSMYGNTEVMLNSVLKGISSEGVPVHTHRVPNEDPSFILSDAYKSAGLVIGCPTYEYSMFPPMKYIMELLKKKFVKFKKALYFGSYGWSGGAQKEFDKLSENMNWDIYESITFNGHPTPEECDKGEEIATKLANDVKKIPSKIKNEDY